MRSHKFSAGWAAFLTAIFVVVSPIVNGASAAGDSASAAAKMFEWPADTAMGVAAAAIDTGSSEYEGDVEASIAASMSGNGISEAQAKNLVELQGLQFDFMEQVTEEYSGTVGGYSLDVTNGVLHVHVTPDFTDGQALTELASSLGIPIAFDETAWSIDALAKAADDLTAKVGSEKAVVTLDYERSTLIVATPDSSALTEVEKAAASITVSIASSNARPVGETVSVPVDISISDLPSVPEDKCTDRYHCGGPLRVGIATWWDESSSTQGYL